MNITTNKGARLRHPSPPKQQAPDENRKPTPEDGFEAAAHQSKSGNWKKALLAGGTVVASGIGGQAHARGANIESVEMVELESQENIHLERSAEKSYEKFIRRDDRGNVTPDLDPPTTTEEAGPYQKAMVWSDKAERYLNKFDREMVTLRSYDNSSRDLNPEKGIVVTHSFRRTGFGNTETSDVLRYDTESRDFLSYSSSFRETLYTPRATDGSRNVRVDSKFTVQIDQENDYNFEHRAEVNHYQHPSQSYSDVVTVTPEGNGRYKFERTVDEAPTYARR